MFFFWIGQNFARNWLLPLPTWIFGIENWSRPHRVEVWQQKPVWRRGGQGGGRWWLMMIFKFSQNSNAWNVSLIFNIWGHIVIYRQHLIINMWLVLIDWRSPNILSRRGETISKMSQFQMFPNFDKERVTKCQFFPVYIDYVKLF